MARRNYLEMSMIETSLSVPAERQKELFGQFDQYVKKIERALQVTVLSRDGEIKILWGARRMPLGQRRFLRAWILWQGAGRR